jgi:hypothetical protein
MDVSSADKSEESVSQNKDLERKLEILNFSMEAAVKQGNLEKELLKAKFEKELLQIKLEKEFTAELAKLEKELLQTKLEKELLQTKLEKESAADLAKLEKEMAAMLAKLEKELLQAKLEKESAAELAKRDNLLADKDIQQLREKLFAAEGMMSARAIFEWILQRAWAEIMASKQFIPRFNESDACSYLERIGKALRACVQFS